VTGNETPVIFFKDVRTTLLKIMFAASGDAGSRLDDDTPNPFGMISKSSGLLASLPFPSILLSWLSGNDLTILTEAFTRSGFDGGLNYYRNLDRNWEHQAAFDGLTVKVPSLFLQGENDTCRVMPGMDAIIAEMPRMAPFLKDSIILPGAGHWLQQERPKEFNFHLSRFLKEL